MWRTTVRSLIFLSALGGLFSFGAGLAHAVEINDEAGFFSKETLDKANQQIAELQKKHGKELRIETYKTVPSGKLDEVKRMDPVDRERFFANWARERAMAQHAKGIFVLITRQPGHVYVAEDRQTRSQGFGNAEGKQLRDKLLDGFRHKDYDKALLEGVGYVSRTMGATPLRAEAEPGVHREIARNRPAEPGMGLLGWALVAVVVFLGLRLITALFRSLFGGGQPAGAGYGPGGGYGGGYGGGGGLFGGFMSGLFGAVAGNWIYNSFFGNSAHAGQSTMFDSTDNAGDNNAADGAGEDFQGSGGSFDDDQSAGGGGDFSGGGDGGDWGGGGGDSGGGDF